MSPKCRKRVESRGSVRTNLLWSQRGTDPASEHEAGKQGSFPREHREAADGSRGSKSALSSLHLQQQEILLIFFFALNPTLISLQTAQSLPEESGPARSISQSGDGGCPLESRARARGQPWCFKFNPNQGSSALWPKRGSTPLILAAKPNPNPLLPSLGFSGGPVVGTGARQDCGACTHLLQSLEDGRRTTWE